MKRVLWMSAGGVFAALGTTGIIVPLLPTTPFYLLALWAYFKASPRHARRLLRHPRYGPVLRAWVRHKAVPRKAKFLAAFLLVLSWITLFLGGMPMRILVFPSLLFVGVAAFVWSRPEPEGTGCDGVKAYWGNS